jgi:succinate-semialdehyde dehydrogenase/glutarate-semialdehyde dehydrogenase
MTMHALNPATGEHIASYDEADDPSVERRLNGACRAFETWRRTPMAERATLMLRVADRLDTQREALAALAVREMGKTIRAAREEVAKCALACRYYAERAPGFLAPEEVRHGGVSAGRVRYDPIGVVLAIMPWNFPFWQVIRAAVPALCAGNVMVLKHASNVPGCALALEGLFAEAGAPAGLFSTLLVSAPRVGALIDDSRVAGVTLTGSEAAGRDVAQRAGAALKKSVLELGGSDPFVVLRSADMDAAVRAAVSARIVNNGQSCIAAKRFIIEEPIAAEFTRRFIDGMRTLVVGDPMDEATQLGPLATRKLRDDLHAQVEATLSRGARLALGGRSRPGPGNFYEPTVLTDVPTDAVAARDELFGPVAPVFVVRSADEALALANGTGFGLGASVWTRDPEEAARFEQNFEAGLAFVNTIVASDPALPFGGVRNSGFGRELGAFGIREFVNIKTVKVQNI